MATSQNSNTSVVWWLLGVFALASGSLFIGFSDDVKFRLNQAELRIMDLERRYERIDEKLSRVIDILEKEQRK